MSLSIRRLGRTFAAEIEGVDLADDHDGATIAALRTALLEHRLLVFRGQKLTNDQHIRFSSKFGPPEIHTVRQYLLPDRPEILVLANRGEKGTRPIANGGAYWHADITYKARPPMGSILYALEVPPEGGDTLFADMCAAYEALDEPIKAQIANLRAVHSYLPRFRSMRRIDSAHKGADRFELSDDQLRELSAVEHPVVRTHPETGQKALFVNEGFTTGIVGMDEAEGRALLEKLNLHATQDAFVYRHRWRVGDVLFWDNRCTMHRATEYDTRFARRMHRTTIQGDVPF